MISTLMLAAAILLPGVEGKELLARAYFDANNVKVGDPMILTIDFIGEADFKDLHPPALSRHVSRQDWKLDDSSAKTDTYRDARRVIYRVRPMREGILWFPALEFAYQGPDGTNLTVRANEIPVHAKVGAQVVVEEMGEDENALPAPPELMREVSLALSPDDEFRWRRALSRPTADGFAEFEFAEARLNEASCAIREGNWARAMKIYQKVEWQIGQTPDVERGIIAALALRYDNPAVELPVWRQVLRPLLKFDWRGRIGIVVGAFALIAFIFWLLGRTIRAVACVAVALGFALTASGQDIFEQMHRQMQQMEQRMQQMHQSAFNVSFGGGGFERQEPVSVTASLTTSKRELQVGDEFEFIIALEAPKTATLDQLRIDPQNNFGLTFDGEAQRLPAVKSTNPTNMIHRISVPVRYDVPYRGNVGFAIQGMVSGSTSSNGGRVNFRFSNSFRADTKPLKIEVKPLPTANQPANFSGIISSGLYLFEYCDLLTPETNDIITITYKMRPNGYVPPKYLVPGAAFEYARTTDRRTGANEIEYRRYFIADGAAKTPVVEIPYYDPRTKTYKTARTGGTAIKYTIPKED